MFVKDPCERCGGRMVRGGRELVHYEYSCMICGATVWRPVPLRILVQERQARDAAIAARRAQDPFGLRQRLEAEVQREIEDLERRERRERAVQMGRSTIEQPEGCIA